VEVKALLTSLGHLPQDSDVASALAAVGAGTRTPVEPWPSRFLNRFSFVLLSLFFWLSSARRYERQNHVSGL
jgi:hypothetical protein